MRVEVVMKRRLRRMGHRTRKAVVAHLRTPNLVMR